MGETFDRLDDRHIGWLREQPVFFVGSAPAGSDGHINVSPKGCAGSFFVLGDRRVAYLDLPGSGIETFAHARENRRICLMFCAFEGPPQILRLYGEATAIDGNDPRFHELLATLRPSPRIRDAARALIDVQITRIASSCGFTVPFMEYKGERDHLFKWMDGRRKKYGDNAMADYIAVNNRESIDGLPGIDADDPTAEATERLSHVGRKL